MSRKINIKHWSDVEDGSKRMVLFTVGSEEEARDLDISGCINSYDLDELASQTNSEIVDYISDEWDEETLIRPTMFLYGVVEERRQSFRDENPQPEVSFYYSIDEANDYRRRHSRSLD